MLDWWKKSLLTDYKFLFIIYVHVINHSYEQNKKVGEAAVLKIKVSKTKTVVTWKETSKSK